MDKLPSFLPSALNLDGEWESILNKLYAVFKEDFVDREIFYQKLKIIIDARKLPDSNGKEEAFWHLISKNDPEQGRIIDYDRAKKLPWLRPIIENHKNSEVLIWSYPSDKNRTRVYLWLFKHDYVVILEEGVRKNKKIIILVTAFCPDERKKKDFKRRYEISLKKQSPPG